jgi:hypothetical protein
VKYWVILGLYLGDTVIYPDYTRVGIFSSGHDCCVVNLSRLLVYVGKYFYTLVTVHRKLRDKEASVCRYKYQEVANPWAANGAVQGDSKPDWKVCNLKSSPTEIADLIEKTGPLQGPVNFTTGPLTFKVKRNLNSSSEDGEELLEVRANVDYTQLFLITAFAYLPDATMDTWLGCGEYLGDTGNFPHVGISQKLRPEFVWRLGIRRQLELMGREHEEYIVVTLTGPVVNESNVTFTGASVVYSKA